MGIFDDLFRQMHCSMHPQLRHYSPESLKDPAELRHQLDYWSLPESFRKECDEAFQATGTTGYYSWNSRCLFSFDSLTPRSPHAALLRNIFVPKEYRGQHCCTEALSKIVHVAESSATCILAIVHPFEICTEHLDDLKSAIDALHRSPHGISYVSNETATRAMNARLRRAGFRNCDLRSTMSDHGATTIPVTHQWIFVPQSVHPSFLSQISSRLVNEVGDESGTKQTAI